MLSDYAIPCNINANESNEIRNQFTTTLDGFLGQAYNYDDHGLTEEWMMTFKDGNFTASDDEVIRTQLESLLDILTVQVQDRVCNEQKVLHLPQLKLGVDVIEAPVWGIDCYTRRMIELVLEGVTGDEGGKGGKRKKGGDGSEGNAVAAAFVERLLLPAINAQKPDMAHNMNNAVEHILKVT